MNFYKSQKGFTLIELLVVTAIIGVLAVVSATIFNSILKSQNKTAIINEARQNGNILIDKFERDVRQATDINLLSSRKIEIFLDGTPSSVIWECVVSGNPLTDNITRANVPVLNQDDISGVAPTSVCNFTLLDTNKSKLVEFTFELQQRNDFGSQFEILVPFTVSVGTRLNQ